MPFTVQGEVEEKTVFQWRLKEFFSLGDQDDTWYISHEFLFGGRRWVLCLLPNTLKPGQLEAYILLGLHLCRSGPPIEATYSLCIRTTKGETGVCRRGTKTFDTSESSTYFVSFIFMKRSELLRRRNELLPQDVLTVTLDLKLGDGSSATGTEKMVEDIGKLWPNGDYTDVIIKVKDGEFKAHRNILAARTPVLGAMFQHNTIEKASGEVTIEDCEPKVFEQLLCYIYRGAPSELTAENAPALYVLADKYLVDEVKALCVGCMRDTLCLDTLCDTLTLLLMYREDELLNAATEFLSRNMIDVMQSVQWQRFMHQHTIWANEIQIRAMKLIQARYKGDQCNIRIST